MISSVTSPLEAINKVFYPEVKLDDETLQKIDRLGQSIIDEMRVFIMFRSRSEKVKPTIGESSRDAVNILIEKMKGVILAKAKKCAVVNQWLTDPRANSIHRQNLLCFWGEKHILEFVGIEGEENIKKIVFRKQKLP